MFLSVSAQKVLCVDDEVPKDRRKYKITTKIYPRKFLSELGKIELAVQHDRNLWVLGQIIITLSL